MPQVVLPVTGFNSANEVEQFADQALERLSTSGLGAINLRPLVSETFADLGSTLYSMRNRQLEGSA